MPANASTRSIWGEVPRTRSCPPMACIRLQRLRISPMPDESMKPTPLKSKMRVCGIRRAISSSICVRRQAAVWWSISPPNAAVSTPPAP